MKLYGDTADSDLKGTIQLFSIFVCIAALVTLVGCGGGTASNPGESEGSGGGNGGSSGGSGSGTVFTGNPPPNYAGNRTTLIRTGDTPSSGVWDAVHQMAFVSEPDLGLVDAISVPGAQIVARIPVPNVEALGISADDTKILATTNSQQIAWIDTSKKQVSQWQVLPLVNDPVSGPQFWVPVNPNTIESNYLNQDALPTYMQNPYVLSNGEVVFEALEGGFFPIVVEWDPSANTATIRRDLPNGGGVSANVAGTEVLFGGAPAAYNLRPLAS